MALGSANPLLLAASGGDSDPVTRSLRLDGGESLSRTFGSTGDSKKFTFACWVKRTELGGNQRIFQASNSNNDDFLRFNNDNTLGYWIYQNGSHNHQGNTTAVFRDVSAWMHVCYVVDTAQATAANRVKIFVNGVSHALSVYPDQNRDCSVMNTAALHYIGRYGNSASEYANLYIADAYFLDGEAVEPVGNFIESNNYGGYKPKEYTGSFGTNGFHLKLDDSSDIGADDAGSNDFTATNLSSHDVMLDTPTKNYATLNSLDAGGGTFSEGNLKWKAGGSHRAVRFTQAALAGDKTYFEVYYPDSWSNQPMIGLMGAEAKISDHQNANPSLWFRSNGYEYNNGSESNASNPTWTNGDIVGVAVDLSAGELKYRVNNGSFTTAFTGLSSSTTWIPAIKGYDTSPSYILNTGGDPTFAGNKTSGQDTSQSEFYYAPPTGFKSLNSSNLDAPTVTPSEHFDILTYTGNSDLYNDSGSTQNVTGVNFDVGMAWIKDRNNDANSSYTSSTMDEYGNYLFDTITGTENGGYNLDYDIATSGGPYLNSGYYGVSSFSAGSGTNRGITVDEAGETNFYYDDGIDPYEERYVAWLWKLGSTGSSSTWNSSYTAPNTEHYNASAGVTTIEVTPASSGNLEVAHSLSAAPEFFFVADDQGYADFTGFPAFHKDLTSGNYLQLDGSDAQSSDSTFFPSGAAHADYIKLGSAFIDEWDNGHNLRIWAFTGVEGFSKFGKYEGNGSTDGAFIYTGFRPAFVLIKNIDASQDWFLLDNKREGYNVVDDFLEPNTSSAEATASTNKADFTANGFKLRGSGSVTNQNNTSFVYAAFAESPFKHANAR